jgi:hypothetical protein
VQQRLAVQDSPASQGFPQDPQFASSVEVSAQVPPQHRSPGSHAFPQLPQWDPSVRVSTHVPGGVPQTSSPSGQWQPPSAQVAPLAQGRSQPPQWRSSVSGSAQSVPQSRNGGSGQRQPPDWQS